MTKIVVDTNCLLDNPELLLDNDKKFAISYITLQELDKLKSNQDLSFPARTSIKLIYELFQQDKIEIINVPIEGITNDEKIVNDCASIDGILMSQDIGALVVAKSKKVETYDLQHVDKEWDRNFKGYIEVTVDDKSYYSLTQNIYQHIEIEDIFMTDSREVPPVNSYVVLYPSSIGADKNYLVFRKFEDRYELVTPSTKNLKAAGIGIEWLHPEQLIAFDCVFNSESKLAVITGKIGSSKTLMSMCGALAATCGHKNKKKYDKILVTRPNIPINKAYQLGFMPGGLEEKMSGWLASIKTNLQFLFECTQKDRENEEAKKIYEEYFEAMPIESIQGASYHNKILLVDECYSPDTEVLTEKGWQRFDELERGIKVLQYNSDIEETSFVEPIRYVEKDYIGDLVNIYNDNGVDLLVTQNHDILLKNKDNEFRKTCAKYFKPSTKEYIPVAGITHTSLSEDDNLTPHERLAIATQADGSIGRVKADGTVSLQFSFSKQRKIDEFMSICKEGNFRVTENKPTLGTVTIAPRRRFWVSLNTSMTKDLWDTFDLVSLTKTKAIKIIESMVIWDGHKNNNSDNSYTYTTCVKTQADFYQAIAHIAGYKTKITKIEDSRSDTFSDVYRLFIDKSKIKLSTQSMNRQDIPYSGKVYCVTVPSGNIMVRRNGKVCIAGNCQLLDSNTLRQIMSRVAEGSKLVLILDPNQTYGANRGMEGYKKLLPHCKGHPLISYVELQNIQRSELVKVVDDIFK